VKEHASSLSYRHDDDRLVLTGCLSHDQIDPLDLAMLSHHRVSSMIPVSMRSHNQSLMIDYDIGKRKPLSEWLRIHQVTEERCLHFLLHVVHHLEQLRDEMLVENRCLLQASMIFVDVQLLDAMFIYWPDQLTEAKESDVAYDLHQLCIQLAKFRSDMGSMRTIMRYLEDPLFSLSRLRRKIITLIDQQALSDHTGKTDDRRAGRDLKHRLLRWLPFVGRDRMRESVSDVIHQQGFTIPLLQSGDPVIGVTLEICSEDGRCQEVSVRHSPFIIGRDPQSADWVYDDIRVSRMHAEIKKVQEGYIIRDLGSRNGSYVNGERLVPYTDRILRSQDRIELADLRCTIQIAEAAATR